LHFASSVCSSSIKLPAGLLRLVLTIIINAVNSTKIIIPSMAVDVAGMQ